MKNQNQWLSRQKEQLKYEYLKNEQLQPLFYICHKIEYDSPIEVKIKINPKFQNQKKTQQKLVDIINDCSEYVFGQDQRKMQAQILKKCQFFQQNINQLALIYKRQEIELQKINKTFYQQLQKMYQINNWGFNNYRICRNISSSYLKTSSYVAQYQEFKNQFIEEYKNQYSDQQLQIKESTSLEMYIYYLQQTKIEANKKVNRIKTIVANQKLLDQNFRTEKIQEYIKINGMQRVEQQLKKTKLSLSTQQDKLKPWKTLLHQFKILTVTQCRDKIGQNISNIQQFIQNPEISDMLDFNPANFIILKRYMNHKCYMFGVHFKNQHSNKIFIYDYLQLCKDIQQKLKIQSLKDYKGYVFHQDLKQVDIKFMITMLNFCFHKNKSHTVSQWFPIDISDEKKQVSPKEIFVDCIYTFQKQQIQQEDQEEYNDILSNQNFDLQSQVQFKKQSKTYFLQSQISDNKKYQYDISINVQIKANFRLENLQKIYEKMDKCKKKAKNIFKIIDQAYSQNKKRLNLTGRGINDIQFQHLLRKSTDQTSHLLLCQNKLSYFSMMVMKQAKWDFLTVIILVDNKVQDKGCKYLTKAKIPLLQILSLANNQISSNGVLYLDKATWNNLRSFDLSFNLISVDGGYNLSKAKWSLLSDRIELDGNQLSLGQLYQLLLFECSNIKIIHCLQSYKQTVQKETKLNTISQKLSSHNKKEKDKNYYWKSIKATRPEKFMNEKLKSVLKLKYNKSVIDV